MGATEEEVNSIILENYKDHRLASVFDYVKKLTLSPSSLSKEDFDNVLNSGISEEELKDAIAVCAAFNYFNRIVEGHFISENSETWNQAADMIKNHGYDKRR
jgi:alkylhydroperoxidase family enzyme